MRNIVLVFLLLTLCLSCIEKAKKESDKRVSEKLVLDSEGQKKPILEDENVQSLKKIDTTFVLDKNRSIEQYKENISKLYQFVSNKSEIHPKYVESIIARSEEEFSAYYSLSYTHNKEELDLYDKSNELIVSMAQEDKANCLALYFNMAEFVDGEYADSFFDDGYFIAEDNTEKFCLIYGNLSALSKERLKDIYDEFCKGFKSPR